MFTRALRVSWALVSACMFAWLLFQCLFHFDCTLCGALNSISLQTLRTSFRLALPSWLAAQMCTSKSWHTHFNASLMTHHPLSLSSSHCRCCRAGMAHFWFISIRFDFRRLIPNKWRYLLIYFCLIEVLHNFFALLAAAVQRHAIQFETVKSPLSLTQKSVNLQIESAFHGKKCRNAVVFSHIFDRNVCRRYLFFSLKSN